jgi:hypothetical protein
MYDGFLLPTTHPRQVPNPMVLATARAFPGASAYYSTFDSSKQIL